MEVILQVEGLACVLDGIKLNVVYVAWQAPICGEHLNKILPLRLRISAKGAAHWPVSISLGSDVQGGIERSKLAEFSVEREMHIALDGRIRWCPLQASLAVFGRDYGLFISQLVENQAVGSDLGSGIEPCEAGADASGGDHVIELRGRRNVGIE